VVLVVEEVIVMEQPQQSEVLPEAAWFWQARSLDEVMADARPFSAEESYAIEDLTDEEWDAFTAALTE
jgi:hypothetical protein